MRRRVAEGPQEDDLSVSSWESLPEDLRNSNLDQARDIEHKLAAVGCELVPGGSGETAPFQFTDSELEFLAELEHERWMTERSRDGWMLAPVPNVQRKETPYLVPWNELDERTRELDREVVRALPQLLTDAGLAIQRQLSKG
jgi:hypothetical protein